MRWRYPFAIPGTGRALGIAALVVNRLAGDRQALKSDRLISRPQHVREKVTIRTQTKLSSQFRLAARECIEHSILLDPFLEVLSQGNLRQFRL